MLVPATFDDARLGRLSRSGSVWISGTLETASGGAIFSLSGDAAAPDAVGIAMAHDFLDRPERVVTSAMSLVNGHVDAREFMARGGCATGLTKAVAAMRTSNLLPTKEGTQ